MYITDSLSWERNTYELVKKAFKRMQFLFKAAKFTNSKEDLKSIYVTYIRSVIHVMKKRKSRKFQNVKINTTRYKKSAIPY